MISANGRYWRQVREGVNLCLPQMDSNCALNTRPPAHRYCRYSNLDTQYAGPNHLLMPGSCPAVPLYDPAIAMNGGNASCLPADSRQAKQNVG